MADIFISYAKNDRSRVEPLAKALEKYDWTVWWDRNIPAGKDFDEIIREELSKARCAIVIWTKNSIKSRYVKGEARYALDREILIPIEIESNINLPFDFHSIQTLSFIDWDGSEDSAEFLKLVDEIAKIIGFLPPETEEDVNKKKEDRRHQEKQKPEAETIPGEIKAKSTPVEKGEAEQILPHADFKPSKTGYTMKIGALAGFVVLVILGILWFVEKSPDKLPTNAERPETKIEMAKTGKLFVEIKPENAKIEVLNLSPKKRFQQGMELEYGKYLIKISSTGYRTIERWLYHSSSKKSPHYITLDKSTKIDSADKKAASTVVNTGEDTKSRKGLLKGRVVSKGNIKGLTILVEFADLATDISADEIEALLNSENSTPNGNYGSVREYFKIISSGKLDYTNKVVGPIKLSHKRDFYKDNSLVNEALDIVVQDLGVDLSEFDSRGEGIVDAMTFLYAGPTVFDGQLWPHNFQFKKNYGNIKTNFYFLTSMGNSPLNLTIGGLCRSAAVMLCRFPSLAFYRKKDGQLERSQAIGAYGLMGNGYSLNEGRTPSPVNPYFRLLAGWIDNVILINDPGKFEAVHGRYNTVFKHETNKSNEFFLIENRYRLDLDYYLPSSGLAIYHCDTDAPMGDQAEKGENRFGIALIRADGNTALPDGQNQDDSGDLFGQVKGKAISFSTKPSSRTWDGSDSGLMVSNISAPGDVISFQVDQPRISISRGEAIENMPIPSGDPGGISSKINISQEGKVRSIKIIIDITHTYIGDLHLALKSPSGKKAILHNRTGGGQDNLKKMYSSDKFEALQAMRMESIQGDWILQISDKTQMDTGQLNSWKLIIEYE